MGDVHIGKYFIRLLQSLVVHAFASSVFEGFFNVAVLKYCLMYQADFAQSCPIHGLKHIRANFGDLVRVAPLAITQLGPRHLQRSRQQRLVQDTHRCCGLGHTIDIDIGACFFATLALTRADLDALLQRQVFVLLHKRKQGLLAQPL